MRLGLCLAAYGDCEMSDALSAVAAHKIDAIDLPLDSPFRLRGDADRLRHPQVRHIRQLLRQAGVEVLCISNSRDCQLILGPHGAQTDPIRSGGRAVKRRHGLRHAHEAIAVASYLDCCFVRLFLGCPDYSRWLTWHDSTVSWNDNVEDLLGELADLAERARRADVRLCLEPHPKQAVFDLQSTEYLLGRLGDIAQSVEICMDPANLAAVGHDPLRFIENLSCVPAMVHAKDVELARADRIGRGWIRYGPQPPLRLSCWLRRNPVACFDHLAV